MSQSFSYLIQCVIQDSIITECSLFSLTLIFLGGEKKSAIVSSPITSYTITELPASSAYKIQVSSFLRDREGSSATVTARTRESIYLKKKKVITVSSFVLLFTVVLCYSGPA